MEKRYYIILSSVFLLILIASVFVSAKDIAYITKDSDKTDSNFVDVFNELSLSFDVIESKNLRNTNFSKYNLIFIGDERIPSIGYVPLKTKKVVLANKFYLKEAGMVERGLTSRIVANSPLVVRKGNSFVQIYDESNVKLGKQRVPYYYIPKRYQTKMTSVASTTLGDEELGDVIARSDGKCFFGITKTEFWTLSAKNLFKECVMFVAGSSSGGDDGNGGNNETGNDGGGNDNGNQTGNETGGNGNNESNGNLTNQMIHDIMLDDLKIKDTDGNLVAGEIPQLVLGNSYRILIDVTNIGNFSENVSFDGMVKLSGSSVKNFSHVSISNIIPGEKKDDKSNRRN